MEQMDTKEKYIQNERGEKIASVIHYPENYSNKTVLLEHGLISNKENYEKEANYLAENGFKAVRFDRRGLGDSDGNFYDTNLTTGIEDSETVIDYMKEREGGESFGIYGASFGGRIGIHTATRNSEVESLVLRSPFTYLRNVARRARNWYHENNGIDMESINFGGGYEEIETYRGKKLFSKLGSFVKDIYQNNLGAPLEKINSPTLIFHGKEDELIPFQDSKKFYKKLDVEKEFLELDGVKHKYSESKKQEVMDKALEWFSQHMN